MGPSASGVWQFADQGFTAIHANNGNTTALVGQANYASFHIQGTWLTFDDDDDYFGIVFGYQNPYQHYLLTWT